MYHLLEKSTDARQSEEWGRFLEHFGWKTEQIENNYLFIRKLPLIQTSFIKVQHPSGPLPLSIFDEIAKKYHALFLVVEPHTRGYDERLLRSSGYLPSTLRYAHSATILIDLRQSEQELFSFFSENVRRNIKKAKKNIVITTIFLRDEKNEQVLEQFYKLYAQVGKMKKFYVPDSKEVFSKMRAFQETSVVLFAYESEVELGATNKRNKKNDQEPIATLWVGSVGKSMIYFHPGNTERGYELNVNYLLVWEALKLAKKMGLEFFDFESIYDPRYPKENKAWMGYTEFKKKFGGEIVQYPPSWIKFYNPVLKAFYRMVTLFQK